MGGNILSKNKYDYTEGTLGTVTETISYGYTDSDWSDLLTSYDGNTITYDQIGNTLSDGTWTYTWTNGKQLEKQTHGPTTVWYTYDANGQRLTKESGNTKYYYIYDGITPKYLRAAIEATDDTIYEMYFQYGQTGLEAIEYIHGSLKDTYYVISNLQGDVIGLIDGSGTEVVSYTYDAWGQLRSMTGSLASTLGQYNPIRYRGYVYDSETGMYYLNSRYYNPEWGRFINADDIAYLGENGSFTGFSLFVYVSNNPILYLDSSGRSITLPPVIQNGLNLPAGGGLPVAIDGTNYYYAIDIHNGELYEYWFDVNGNLVWGRHHSFHNKPWAHKNPHDHKGGKDKEGNNTLVGGPQPVDEKFQPPPKQNNNLTIKKEVNNDHMKVAIGIAIGVVVYQAIKWTAATVLAPATGCASLAIAALAP